MISNYAEAKPTSLNLPTNCFTALCTLSISYFTKPPCRRELKQHVGWRRYPEAGTKTSKERDTTKKKKSKFWGCSAQARRLVNIFNWVSGFPSSLVCLTFFGSKKLGWFVEDRSLAHILSVITTLFCLSVIR